MTFGPLETRLRERRDQGRKLLVPYITAGYPVGDWPRLIEGMAAAGADAIEIGIPFSDPVMDGPTIQESSSLALAAGGNPLEAIDLTRSVDVDVPLVAMTYYNICFRMGHRRFANRLLDAGFAGAILPDLSLEEATPWTESADDAGIETVFLAAPTSPPERVEALVDRCRGFVYGVGLVGITGERAELAASASEMARTLKAVTDKPVLIGIGISNPAQAAEVSETADGVVVGSAVIRQILDNDGAIEPAIEFVASLRRGLDGG